MAGVVAPRVGAADPLHEAAYRDVSGGRKDQVVVLGDQAVGVQPHRVDRQLGGEDAFEGKTVGV